MAKSIVLRSLALSQAQLRAFVQFKDAGDKIFYDKDKYNSELSPRWCLASQSLAFVLAANRYYPNATEHNFLLTEEHVAGFHEMFEIADTIYHSYYKYQLSTNPLEPYKTFFTALAKFRHKIEEI